MAFDKTLLPQSNRPQNITTALAAGSLTITTATAYKTASEIIIELDYSDLSVGYIKIGHGRLKVGGATGQFDTGTEITW